jgi:PAS domain S-box-containing protein
VSKQPSQPAVSEQLTYGWVALTVVVVTALEGVRASGSQPPIPYLAVYASVVFVAGLGGKRPGLVAALMASAFVVAGWARGLGPPTLIGGPLQVVAGIALHGVTAWVVGSARDDSRRLLTEETATRRRAENWLEVVERAALVMRGELDAEWRWVRAPVRLADSLGRSAESLRGASLEELLVDGADPAFREVAEGLRRGATMASECELRLVGPGGQHLVVEASFARVHEHGRVVGFVAWFRDVTEQRRAQRERAALQTRVEQAQRVDSLGVLAGGVAHDFNNLLVPILANARMLEEELPEGGMHRELAAEVADAAQRAAELVAQMLTYAGKAPVEHRTVDLREVVRDVARLGSSAFPPEVVVDVELCEEAPCVWGSRVHLEQVAMNLLVNAGQACGAQGRVRIACAVRSVDEVDGAQVIGELSADVASVSVLSVVDDGVGIPSEKANRIFEPFFTEREGGRGLGLAVVFGIVRRAGGAICLQTEAGEGTRFDVLLPLHAEGTAPAAEAAASAGEG